MRYDPNYTKESVSIVVGDQLATTRTTDSHVVWELGQLGGFIGVDVRTIRLFDAAGSLLSQQVKRVSKGSHLNFASRLRKPAPQTQLASVAS